MKCMKFVFDEQNHNIMFDWLGLGPKRHIKHVFSNPRFQHGVTILTQYYCWSVQHFEFCLNSLSTSKIWIEKQVYIYCEEYTSCVVAMFNPIEILLLCTIRGYILIQQAYTLRF